MGPDQVVFAEKKGLVDLGDGLLRLANQVREAPEAQGTAPRHERLEDLPVDPRKPAGIDPPGGQGSLDNDAMDDGPQRAFPPLGLIAVTRWHLAYSTHWASF